MTEHNSAAATEAPQESTPSPWILNRGEFHAQFLFMTAQHCIFCIGLVAGLSASVLVATTSGLWQSVFIIVNILGLCVVLLNIKVYVSTKDLFSSRVFGLQIPHTILVATSITGWIAVQPGFIKLIALLMAVIIFLLCDLYYLGTRARGRQSLLKVGG